MQLESAGRAVTVYGENTAKYVIWMHTFSDEGAAAFALLPPEMQAETALVTIAMPDPDWNAQLSPGKHRRCSKRNRRLQEMPIHICTF